jgi:Glycosyl transferase family 2
MATVDVVVPCYNYGCFLREAVQSVLSQQGHVRVLVIDDASVDETAEVAARLAQDDARVSFLRHTANRGHIATYNEGIAWSSADYMLVLSADDFLLPGALARATALMDAHPQVGLTFGRCIDLYPGDPPPNPGRYEGETRWCILSGIEFIKLSGARCLVPTSTAIVRTALQKHIGEYRPHLSHAGDMEMWIRFALGGSVGFIDAHQAVYRRHERNMSLAFNGGLRDLQQRRAVLDGLLGTNAENQPDLPALHRSLVQSLAGDAVSFAGQAYNRGDVAEYERILEFAVTLWPEIRRSRQWRRVVWKRRLGLRLWTAVHPLILELRQRGLSLGAEAARVRSPVPSDKDQG